MIIDVLIDRILLKNTRVCVGLDPRPEQLPPGLLARAIKSLGHTPEAMADAFLTWGKGIIDATAEYAACVKPQIAMYERLGAAGMAAYAKTVAHAKERGVIVIGDIKRGDIASTAEAYSDGHIGEITVEGTAFRPFDADFVTVNPYLGRDSVEPFFKNCGAYDKGLFVLVKTSNPGGADLQDLELGTGERLYEHVGGLVERWGCDFVGKHGYSSIGAVVGATWPAQAAALRARMPHTFFLIPGYGAQGGSAADAAVCFKEGLGGVVNSSRGITAAWMSPAHKEAYGAGGATEQYAELAAAAALRMRDDLNNHICG